MNSHKELESNIIQAIDFLGVANLGAALLSGVLLFTPAKTYGLLGIGGSLGSQVAYSITRSRIERVSKAVLDATESSYQAAILGKDGEIYSLKGSIEQLTKTANALGKEAMVSTQTIQGLRGEVEALTTQADKQKRLIETITATLSDALSQARQMAEESLDEWQLKLQGLTSKKSQYPKLEQRLSELSEEAEGLISDYGVKVAQTPNKWDSLPILLDLYYCLNDELLNVKTKAIQAIAKLTNQETQLELQEVNEILEEWQSANLVPRDKLEHIIRNYEAALNEFRMDFSKRFDVTHQFALALEGQTQEDDKFVQGILAKMQELETKIHHLSRPITYPGATRTDMRIANIVIAYFERLGIILDRAGSDYRGHEATLEFISDRTGRLVLASELNEHSERLQGLTHVLNKPEFKLDSETGLMTLLVRWSQKPKADINDISKLWIPAVKFVSTVKGWSRVRLTGGSESGKSPTAENLAIAILTHRPGTPKLYNPQFDSVKNFWTLPVVGTTHSDSEKGIAELAKLVDARANGEQSRDEFELYIFDEVDSTMSHTKGKKSVIGGNVNFIIKQASHQNLGVIFIGQNANVSEYPGMDRSDWNSAVNVHIGANAYDAITNSNRFTSDEQSKLKATADKITEFCEGKNEELGLEKTDPQAYRYALVIEPNKKPYFIELPAFGTYTFDKIQQRQQSTPGVESATPDNTTQSLKALKIGNTNGAAMEPQSGYVGSSCPGCNSTNRKKDGKYKGLQRYQCKDCGKRYTEGE